MFQTLAFSAHCPVIDLFSSFVFDFCLCVWFLVFGFLRQGFSVALELVLELALVDQAGLELRDPPASASSVLGLKACTTPWPIK